MAEREASAGNDQFTFGVQLLGLVTVLLPATGFLIRYVAFSANPLTTGPAEVLALAAPISQLAVTGFYSVFLALLMFGIAALYQLAERLPEPSQRWARFLAIAILVVLAVFMLLVAWADAIDYLIAPVAAFGAVIITYHQLHRRGRRLTYRHGGWLVIPVLALGVASYGLGYNPGGITVANYRFAPSAQLSDGRFVQLGENGSTVFLQSCAVPSSIDAIGNGEILLETGVTSIDRKPTPSVFGMVFQHEPPAPGYQLRC
jgi:hypothetical protein